MTAQIEPMTLSSMMSPLPRALAIVPPMTEPMTPRTSVHSRPMCCRPGRIARASKPTMRPKTMNTDHEVLLLTTSAECWQR